MDKIIESIKDSGAYLRTQEQSLDSLIDTLLGSDNRLKSFLLLKMLVTKSEVALSKMKDEIQDIEKRLLKDTDEVCKQAEDVVKGVKTHSDWCKDIIDAIGALCKDSDLENRQTTIHQQIEEMESNLKELIEKRNSIPLEQLDTKA